MKIFDKRCGWSVEGAYIETLPAELPVTEDQMRVYYGVLTDDRKYQELLTAAFPRIVLQKDEGSFVIVPINPDCYCTDSAEDQA